MSTVSIAVLAALSLAPAPRDTVPLYADLGTLEVPITTSVPLAQQYFNQGMRLRYAFNHPEAIRSFRAAIALDPKCAMCWWGVAFALGPNINAPMDAASGAQAWEAATFARELSEGVSQRERAYIYALSQRYALASPPTRQALHVSPLTVPPDRIWARYTAIGAVALNVHIRHDKSIQAGRVIAGIQLVLCLVWRLQVAYDQLAGCGYLQRDSSTAIWRNR